MSDIYITIENEEPLEVIEMVEKGDAGKSAYQSYLETTDDDPPMTEEEWSAADGGSGTVDAAAVAAITHSATEKGTPGDADEIGIADSAVSFGWKKITWAGIKTTLKAYFDTLYQAAGVTWDTLAGKPSAFTPTAHTHSWGTITDKPIAFTPEAHTHSWGTITDKPLSFTPDLTGVSPGDIGAATAAQGAKADTAIQAADLATASVDYANTAGSTALLLSGTISGTTSFEGGAAAQFRTALGAGTAGNAIFVATLYSGVGSVRRLMGLDTTDTPYFSQVSGVNLTASNVIRLTNAVDLSASGVTLMSASQSVRFTAFIGGPLWTTLNSPSAGVLEQKNGSAAQKFRVFGTTTGSKYAQLEHNGTNAKLSSSSGDLHISNIPTSNPGPGIIWNDGGVLKIGT